MKIFIIGTLTVVVLLLILRPGMNIEATGPDALYQENLRKFKAALKKVIADNDHPEITAALFAAPPRVESRP